MNTSFHEIDGIKIRVARRARAGALTLIMTNALPQSILCWHSVWERLAQRFDLLAVDMPGFGLSDGGIEMAPGAHARFLVKVMDHFGIEKGFGLGPDVGVPIMLSFASQYPERLVGLNIYDGPGTWPPDFEPGLNAATTSPLMQKVIKGWLMRRVFMKGNLKTATALGYHTYQPTEAQRKEYRELCYDVATHKNAIDFLGSYPKELPRIEAALPSISLPVLITWGAHDKFVFPSNGEKIHERLPNSQIIVFDNAGHFSHEDADQEWIDVLFRFIDAQ